MIDFQAFKEVSLCLDGIACMYVCIGRNHQQREESDREKGRRSHWLLPRQGETEMVMTREGRRDDAAG